MIYSTCIGSYETIEKTRTGTQLVTVKCIRHWGLPRRARSCGNQKGFMREGYIGVDLGGFILSGENKGKGGFFGSK